MTIETIGMSECARIISEMIRPESASGKMLYRDYGEILSMLESGHGTFIENDAGVPVSFCGFYEYDRFIEVGSTITNPKYRGHGLATECLYQVLDAIQHSQKEIIAFCNSDSAGLFARAGFAEMPKVLMPDEARAFCASCAEYSSFPLCHCCYMAFCDHVEKSQQGIWHTVLSNPKCEKLQETVELYSQVWAEPPWDEYDWDLDAVEGELQEASDNPGAVFLASMVGGKINGFTIGYPVDKMALAEKAGGSQLEHLYEGREEIFYVAELGVAKESRCHGTGLMLSQMLCCDASVRGFDRLVLRTHIEAHPARMLYGKLGFVDIGILDANYPDRTYWVRDEKP